MVLGRYIYRNVRRGFIAIHDYWISSKIISKHINNEGKSTNRVNIFFDIMYCTFKYGANDLNYQMYEYYGKSHEYRNSFITWLRTYKIQNKLDPIATSKLLSKVNFNEICVDCLKRVWINCTTLEEVEIKDFIKKYHKVIAKPINSALGRGVHIVSDEGLPMDISYLKTSNGGYILEEILHNVPELEILNPSSLNTIRFVTATNKFGEYSILSAILRMGVGDTIVDNLCTGGIACKIDINTGCLIGCAKDVHGGKYFKHPTSGVIFNNYQLPHFSDCLALVDTLCKRIPNARYVGWDIAITTNGVCVIEGNMPPSEETTEFSLEGQWWNLLNILDIKK